MVCDNCARLTRELREAREELAEYEGALDVTEDMAVFKLGRALKIRPQTAKLLLTLASRPDRMFGIDLLSDALGYAGAGTETLAPSGCLLSQSIRVNVVRARAALKSLGFDKRALTTAYGKGYGLSEDAAKAVLEAAR